MAFSENNKNTLRNISTDNMRLFTEEESQVLKKIIPKKIFSGINIVEEPEQNLFPESQLNVLNNL